jgi:hypothetical protein
MPTISAGTILLICVIYSVKHRGSDWPGIVLGMCLGAVGSKGALGNIINPIADAIVSLFQAALDALNAYMAGRAGGGGGGGGPAKSGNVPAGVLVAIRYQLGLIGLGR